MKIDRFKYGVTFNSERGEYSCGDEHMETVDFVGNDLDELIKEVIDDSIEQDYVLKYYSCDKGGDVVGIFCDKWSVEEVEGTDELPSPTAILYRESR